MRNLTQTEKLAELNKWRKFICGQAFKAYRRLMAVGVGIELEDVESMMIESFLKAQASFNPEFGNGISAYAGRAMLNDFNRYAEKVIAERVQHGVASQSELEAHMESDTDFWETANVDGAVLAGSLAAMVEDPMELLERRQTVVSVLERMSPAARGVLRMLVDPPRVLQEAFDDHVADLRARRADGERVVVPMSMDADFILDFICRRQNLALDANARRKIHKDLKIARDAGRSL